MCVPRNQGGTQQQTQQLCYFTDCYDSKVVHSDSVQIQQSAQREDTAQVHNFFLKDGPQLVFSRLYTYADLIDWFLDHLDYL